MDRTTRSSLGSSGAVAARTRDGRCLDVRSWSDTVSVRWGWPVHGSQSAPDPPHRSLHSPETESTQTGVAETAVRGLLPSPSSLYL